MRFDILTLFPEMFTSYLGESLLKLAIEKELIEVHTWNIRDWTKDRRRSVDDKPYGGGPGMLLMCQPIFDCVESVQAEAEPGQLVMLSPQGERLTQGVAREFAAEPSGRLLLLCGRYEGFDERIREGLKPREISAGDFVCNGGEVPAMLVIETVSRLVPGVLGDEESSQTDSFAASPRLEHPQYTRPREYRGMTVPEVLLNGNHQEIAAWRDRQSLKRTRERRGDLLEDDTH